MHKFILAIRYLLKRPISYFSVAAVALCVFVVFVVITVLSGLTEEYKKNTHLLVGDCVVSTKSLVGFGHYEEFISLLEDASIVEAVSPAIRTYGLISAETDLGPVLVNGNETVEIVGIYPGKHSQVTGFGEWLHYHDEPVNAFKPNYAPEKDGCVPGINYMYRRDSEGQYYIPPDPPEVKLNITCFPLTAKGALARAGAGQVSTKAFYYSDHFRSDVAMADWRRIFISFEQAQMLCGMQTQQRRINTIHIKFQPKVKLDVGCAYIAELWRSFVKRNSDSRYVNLLDNVNVQSWKVYSRETIAIAETQEIMMIVIFAMIGIITIFIVFVVFYMLVSHKIKDIGILKSVGASSIDILMLFLYFACLVGIVGSAIGGIAGWRFLVHINEIEDWLFEHFDFQLWDRALIAIGDIPNTIKPVVLTTIIFTAIVSCMIGALIPSLHASRLKPVEALQVNQL